MRLFLRELRSARTPIVVWSLGSMLFVASGMGRFAATRTAGASIHELMSAIPAPLRIVLGIGNFDLTTALGFYGPLFSYITVMAAVHAVLFGADVLSKEERDHTAEFLYAKPVSRTRVVSIKLAAGLVAIVAVNLAMLASSLGIVGRFDASAATRDEILVLMAGLFLVQGLFLLIGAAVAATVGSARAAAGRATAVLLATFVLSLIVDLQPSAEPLRALTPFQYFSAARVMGSGIEGWLVAFTVGVCALLLAAVYRGYDRRDIAA